MKKLILLALLTVGLTSCSGYDLSSLPINAENATEMGNLIKTASETKETIYYEAVKNRDKIYADMYASQGFDLKWKMSKQKIGDTTVLVPMPEVSYKAPPVFSQPLPNGPSKHPVWATIDKATGLFLDGFKWWVGYKGVTELWNRSAPQYQGPYAPVSNSYNPITTTSTFLPVTP